MALTAYDYSISTDFPNHKVAPDRLSLQIRESSITIALDRVDTSGDVCSIWFKDPLPPLDLATLNAIVATHNGEPLPPNAQLVQLGGPMDPDKKPIVTFTPATRGFNTWIVGRGDDVPLGPTGRGKGPRLGLTFGPGEAPTTKSVTWSFLEPVEVHDGQLNWGPVASWGPDDEFSVSIVIPPNTPTPTPGTGNVNEVLVGPGMALYVPAPLNDGSHTVNLASAIPAPAQPDFSGCWDVDYATGVISPNLSGKGSYSLYNFPIESWLLRGITMNNSIGVYDLDVYKVEWTHPSWQSKLTVTKNSPGEGHVYGWLFCFRTNTTELP